MAEVQSSALDLINDYLSRGGCRLIIDNLHCGVERDDLEFVFSFFGPLRKVSIFYDAAGRPLGSGEIVYSWVTDGLRALKYLNGVSLEGQPMRITCAGRALPEDKPDRRPVRERIGPKVGSKRKPTQATKNAMRYWNVPTGAVTKEQLDQDIDEYMFKKSRFD